MCTFQSYIVVVVVAVGGGTSCLVMPLSVPLRKEAIWLPSIQTIKELLSMQGTFLDQAFRTFAHDLRRRWSKQCGSVAPVAVHRGRKARILVFSYAGVETMWRTRVSGRWDVMYEQIGVYYRCTCR